MRAEPETSFKKLENIIEDLGDNSGRWSKAINNELKKDINLAFSLLFSEDLPESKVLNKAKRLISEREG